MSSIPLRAKAAYYSRKSIRAETEFTASLPQDRSDQQVDFDTCNRLLSSASLDHCGKFSNTVKGFPDE